MFSRRETDTGAGREIGAATARHLAAEGGILGAARILGTAGIFRTAGTFGTPGTFRAR